MPHSTTQDIENQIFNMSSSKFNELAWDILCFQLQNLAIFQQWHTHFPIDNQTETPVLHQLGIHFQPDFLPIQFFKSHSIIIPSGNIDRDFGNVDLTNKRNSTSIDTSSLLTFTSSGTTLNQPSKHPVLKPNLYESSFLMGFELRFGKPQDYCIVGLLPSYLERSGSSLIYMVEHLVKQGKPGSGFYLNEYELLWEQVQKNEENGIKTIIFGVTFGLLLMGDWISQHRPNSSQLHHTTIIETGGMKGRGKELTRPELHAILKQNWKIKSIDSEYGMTELLSQAYTHPVSGRFVCPPWMKVIIQDPMDAKTYMGFGKTGRICVMDLANLYSCAFIATDDLGKVYEDGSFEVMGRLDFSDIRGCNQLL